MRAQRRQIIAALPDDYPLIYGDLPMAGEPQPTCEQQLGAAVIERLVREIRLCRRKESEEIILAIESENLEFWCDVAGINVGFARAILRDLARERGLL